MILKINDDYRITTDEKCITVEKRRLIKEGTTSKTLKAGDEIFEAIAFFGEFEHAYRFMLKHGILTSDLNSFTDIVELISTIGQEIKKSLSKTSIDSIRRENERLTAEVESLKSKLEKLEVSQ